MAAAAERLKSTPERIEVGDDTRAMMLYPATIPRIPGALAARPLHEGDADGTLSEATTAVLAAFRKEIRVDPAGLPDQATRWRLLRK